MRTSGRTISVVLFAAIFALTAIGSYAIVRQYNQLFVMDSAEVEITRLRNGVVAILDLVRVRDAIENIRAPEDLAGVPGTELMDSIDYLFVRLNTLQIAHSSAGHDTADRTVTDLSALIDKLDGAVTGPPEDFLSRRSDIQTDIKRTIGTIVNYYDAQKKMHVNAMQRQGHLRERLLTLVFALTATFVIISSTSIYLWRREIAARIKRREAEERAHILAYYDPLTGLANRTTFLKEAETALGAHKNPALFLIDLDEFKLVNDTYGHHAADRVLCSVAERLRQLFEAQGGTAARLAGDEFAALLPEAEVVGDLGKFANDVREKLAAPMSYDGSQLSPRTSAGIATPALVNGQTAPSLNGLLRAADYALYKAKTTGRFRCMIYDTEMARSVSLRRELKIAMPAALEAEEFFIEYQPQINLETGRLHGFEALVRWQHGDQVFQPCEFVEIAEESDFITRLDRWVMRTAIAEARRWQALSPKPVSISVNLSARNFHRSSIVDDITRMLDDSGFPPELLTIELTESVLIKDWKQTRDTLHRLTELGMKVALDDFGTGYSSLSYLRQLDVTEVKIDRSFLVDIEASDRTRMMLDALVDIVRSLDMQLVVEGVETPGQARILAGLGGHIGQGFLFSQPVSRLAASDLIRSGMIFDIGTERSSRGWRPANETQVG